MGSVDCSYSLARQLQIHLESDKKPFMTPWKWFTNRSKKKERDTSVVLISNGSTPDVRRFPVDVEFHRNKLIDSNLSTVMPVPDGVDLNEWLATQTIFLFDCINMLFGCLCEFCTPIACPSMNGPANVQYYWPDEKGKKSKLSAPQYIDLVTSYANSCIKDEAIFPTKYGNVFPPTFQQTIKNIHRLLCHVLVHMQHSHTSHLQSLDLSAHYTTVLQHFLLFNKTFSLASDTDVALFDGIHEVLNAPVSVPAFPEPFSPSVTPCDDERFVGDHLPQQNHTSTMPAQTVMPPRLSDGEEKVKRDSIVVVDEYVPVFTIVT